MKIFGLMITEWVGILGFLLGIANFVINHRRAKADSAGKLQAYLRSELASRFRLQISHDTRWSALTWALDKGLDRSEAEAICVSLLTEYTKNPDSAKQLVTEEMRRYEEIKTKKS